MKKNNIILTLVFSAFVLLQGCTIDEFVPENSLTVELLVTSEDDLLNLNIGNYSFAASGASYGGQAYLASELIGSADRCIWNGTFIQPDQYDRKSMTTDNTFVQSLFADNYDVVNQSNIILSNLDVIESSGELRSRIEGEAKFLRGLEFFDLARFYGQQYNPGGGNSQPAVAIKLTSSLDELSNLPRNSVEEVYAQAITDLTDAYNLLPNTNGIFADKYAAQALLARVYLQQGNYAAARDAANDVLQNSGHFLMSAYEQAFNNDDNVPEDVFSFQISLENGANNMVLFFALSANGGRGGNPDTAITDTYYNSFPAGDVRGSFFVVGGGGNATSKYQVDNANVPFIRLAEMYLIRAEGNVRLNTSIGDTPENDINALRNRAMAPTVTSPSLDVVLAERNFELGMEGHLLHDVHRLGLQVNDLPANSPRLIMPIPQAEINANPNATQNPGY